MPKTLERPAVHDAPVLPPEVDFRPPVRDVPPREIEPPPRATRFVRWMGWMLVFAVIVVAAGVVGALVMSDDAVVDTDGSFAANEVARLGALAPAVVVDVDGSFTANESARFEALTVVDASFADAEMVRFMALAPVVDASFADAEMVRFMALAPVVDASFADAELARFMRLAPVG